MPYSKTLSSMTLLISVIKIKKLYKIMTFQIKRHCTFNYT